MRFVALIEEEEGEGDLQGFIRNSSIYVETLRHKTSIMLPMENSNM